MVNCLPFPTAGFEQRVVFLKFGCRGVDPGPAIAQQTFIRFVRAARQIEIMPLSTIFNIFTPVADIRRMLQPLAAVLHKIRTMPVAGNDPAAAAAPRTLFRWILTHAAPVTLAFADTIVPPAFFRNTVLANLTHNRRVIPVQFFRNACRLQPGIQIVFEFTAVLFSQV